MKADLETKLKVEGDYSSEKEIEFLEKNVVFVQDEILKSVQVLLKNNSYLSELDIKWIGELEAHHKSTPRSMANFQQ